MMRGERKREVPLQKVTELYRRENAYENPMSLVRLEATLQRKSVLWKPRPRQIS